MRLTGPEVSLLQAGGHDGLLGENRQQGIVGSNLCQGCKQQTSSPFPPCCRILFFRREECWAHPNFITFLVDDVKQSDYLGHFRSRESLKCQARTCSAGCQAKRSTMRRVFQMKVISSTFETRMKSQASTSKATAVCMAKLTSSTPRVLWERSFFCFSLRGLQGLQSEIL